MSRICASVILMSVLAAQATAQSKTYTLAETFSEQSAYRVELKTTISGKLSVKTASDKPFTAVGLAGSSHIVYDERPLPSAEASILKTARCYSQVEFSRIIGEQKQEAGIRDKVRRMIVLRSETGRKAPFSPDGPLTFSEIDVVKNDLFSPTLVAGLLPKKPVSVGDTWKADTAAVLDLTDLDSIEEGSLNLEFQSIVTVNSRKQAKLLVLGTVKGLNEDGPNRQKLEGTAYYDLEKNRFCYLKLSGTHELLDREGNSTGKIEGTFIMTRDDVGQLDRISEAALKGVELNQNADNTLLLFDNPDFGVSFTYPRRWRIGVVQGRQFTVEESKGAAVLFTLTPTNRIPTPKVFIDEVKVSLTKQKAKVSPISDVTRFSTKPLIERFGLDAETENGQARLEYAILSTTEGGVLMAARLPVKVAAELQPDLDRILKSLTLTKTVSAK